MKFSLIICTYQRHTAILRLLESVKAQSFYPNEIIIVDASADDLTQREVEDLSCTGLKYFKVNDKHKGLTRQRNFGISQVNEGLDLICFLDDDVVLTEDYFKNLITTYSEFPQAIGVGGYIIDEIKWEKKKAENTDYEFDGWVRKLGSRYNLRKSLKLLSKLPPGYMPEFSHGFPIGFLPPSGKTYQVEYFMGGVSSYRKKLFENLRFSNYFEGYGLYEDLEFCLRASKIGKLYVNTSARLYHYHDFSGRPNKYLYGKMVIRNGWYVWKKRFPNPSLHARLKWHSTALLLTFIRLGNIFSTNKRAEALTEGLGRIVGWWSLFIKKPGL